MSEAQSLNFEQLRKEAKTLVKLCRAGDSDGIERIRKQLPDLSGLDDREIGSQIKLSDVHHAIAREQGFRSWADLKRCDEPAARFLAAVRGGNLRIATEELRRFPDLAELNIHIAAALGDPDVLRSHLVQNPASITSGEEGWTPLRYVCASPFHRFSSRHHLGLKECGALLMDHGATADPSSIAHAVSGNNRLMMLLLLQRNKDMAPEIKDSLKGWAPANPLGPAMRKLLNDPAFREELCRRRSPEKQAQIEHFMAGLPESAGKMSPEEWKDLQFMKVVAESGPGPTVDSNVTFWKIGFKHGLDPNAVGDVDDLTPLHQFAMQVSDVHDALAELFLAQGADPNAVAKDGRTPYWFAVRAGNQRVADLLLAHGAKPDSVMLADELIGACQRADAATVRSFIRRHPGLLKLAEADIHETFMTAAKQDNIPVIRLMAEAGFDLSLTDDSGATVLHVAAWSGHVDMVRLLIEFHAPVNIRDTTYRTSPLGWAVHASTHGLHAPLIRLKDLKKQSSIIEENYCAVVGALIDAGSDYKTAVARPGIELASTASPKIAELLKCRGF